MNTIALQHATTAIASNGLRRGILNPAGLSAHSPVFVLHEPHSP